MNYDLIIILAIIIIPVLASGFVRSTYNKYSNIKNNNGLSGFEIARKILDKNGLQDIHVVATNGTMSDHYDPSRKVVRLSKEVFDSSTIAASSIAAHECGHAIQDKDKYFFLKLRSVLYPIVNITSSIAYYVIFIGFIFELLDLARIGIAFVSLGLIFQIITLPVEFNASKRAEKELENLNILNRNEIEGSQKMLTSAALTYVAGTLASALQLLRLIGMVDRD